MLNEGPAALDAHERGLTYAGFGYWSDSSGNTVAKTVDDELVFLSQDQIKKPTRTADKVAHIPAYVKHFKPDVEYDELPRRLFTKQEITAPEFLRFVKLAKEYYDLGNAPPGSNMVHNGRGYYKDVLVGDKWVVKVAKKQTMQPEQAILDYMATIEELIKYIPETHYFEFDNKFGVQVQRRCDVIDYLDSDERRLVTNDPQYQELVQILENYGITDIHEGNIGYDETGQIKVIDVGGWNE